MILRGAIPAAILAIAVELAFAAIERKVSPPK
jgi:ABC-type proline/glycine betaine transport system permease subunit